MRRSIASLRGLLLLIAAAIPGCRSSTAPGPGDFDAVATGDDHTCALSGGVAYCWGSNEVDQLGTQQSTEVCGRLMTPCGVVPLPVPATATFVTLSGGAWHTCALSGEGLAFCWGATSYGNLGSTLRSGRRERPGLISDAVHFYSVGTGSRHSCGLTSEGQAHCWGENDMGQLGNGEFTEVGDAPALSPVEVRGGLVFASMDVGGNRACGVTGDGIAYCWGSGQAGSLGTGDPENRNRPVPVSGDLRFVSVTVGGGHACGVVQDGTAYCWGLNTSGQLGSGGQSAGSDVPIPVGGGIQFEVLAAGGVHTCGMSSDGATYCWGDNLFGALGSNTATEHCGPFDAPCATNPVMVSGGLRFVSLSAGGRHTCGLTATAELYCWGNNFFGQLGEPPSDGETCGSSAEPCRRQPIRVARNE